MIKNFFVSKSLNIITDIYPDYSDSKIDEIRYGLEATYLSLTKLVVILLLTVILGIFKEAILLLFFFNNLRLTGFGIHATKSWMCWIASTLLFIGFPYLCIYLNIPNFIHYIILFLSILCFFLYAPADTKKRPLVRKNRRTKFKIITIIIALIYCFIFLYTDNALIRNTISSSMLIEAVLIHPLTYRVFKLPYKNYESYVFSK